MPVKSVQWATAAALAAVPAGETFAGGKPVECYQRYEQPAVYDTVQGQVLVRPGSNFEKVKPAIYGKEKRPTLISPERVTYRTTPAQYRTVREKVLLYPARTVARTVPAVTDIVYRKVKVDGGYAWEYRKIHGRWVLCKVKRKATYQTVGETVVVHPARTVYEKAPAEYGYRDRAVLVNPERKEAVIIPAAYGYTIERVLIQPELRYVLEIPPSYQTVARTVVVSEAVSGWERVEIPKHCRH